MLVNPDASGTARNVAAAQNAARAFGRSLRVFGAKNESQIDAAFNSIVQDAPGALILSAKSFFNARKSQIVARIARLAIPAVHNGREWAIAGGLFSYGADIIKAHRLAGLYTARILKGEKPADLPVMYPTKFELVINLKTARTLGLELPPQNSCTRRRGDRIERREFIAVRRRSGDVANGGAGAAAAADRRDHERPSRAIRICRSG